MCLECSNFITPYIHKLLRQFLEHKQLSIVGVLYFRCSSTEYTFKACEDMKQLVQSNRSN